MQDPKQTLGVPFGAWVAGTQAAIGSIMATSTGLAVQTHQGLATLGAPMTATAAARALSVLRYSSYADAVGALLEKLNAGALRPRWSVCFDAAKPHESHALPLDWDYTDCVVYRFLVLGVEVKKLISLSSPYIDKRVQYELRGTDHSRLWENALLPENNPEVARCLNSWLSTEFDRLSSARLASAATPDTIRDLCQMFDLMQSGAAFAPPANYTQEVRKRRARSLGNTPLDLF